MKIKAAELQSLIRAIFCTAGCNETEAGTIARRLVDANLVGHDSHGAIQVPNYLKWIRSGNVVCNQRIRVEVDRDAFAIVDGQFGFGQVLGQQTMELAITKAKKFGTAMVGLRNSGHLGRVGDWPEMAAAAGCVSLHFVNTTGLGILMPPHGGYESRLSANPIAAGVPRRDGPPIILDISTCIIAEGKIRVALNSGTMIPDGCALDAKGQPTNDPHAFYGPPIGSILPFGGHKGYGLGLIAEILAGALTGSVCSTPNTTRLVNNMMSVVFDPTWVQSPDSFYSELQRFVEYVKSSRTIAPNGEILLPGEVEARNRSTRGEHGIELDVTTWQNLEKAAGDLGIRV